MTDENTPDPGTIVPQSRQDACAKRSRAGAIVLALCALYCAWLGADLFRRAPQVQRDFAIYYYAAAAHRHGHDPYDLATLKRLSGGRAILAFIYPAATLYAFYPFTALDYDDAARLYLALKFLAVAALLLLWRNVFLDRRGGVFFYFFCLLGFNAAIYIDLMSGNAGLFEQLAIWTALACLLAGRDAIFAVLIALAAVFKITPILFLMLLPLLRGRRGERALLIGLALFGAILGASAFVPFGREFWAVSGGKSTVEFGITAPSTHAFMRACCGLAVALTQSKPVGDGLPWALYVAAVAAILFFSWRAWRRSAGFQPAMQAGKMPALLVLFFCLVYALVLPRFKDYSYILLLAPTAVLVRRWEGGRGLPLLALALLVYPANTVFRLPVLEVLFPFFMNYHPWLIAVAVWGLYLKLLHCGAGAVDSRITSSVATS